MLRRKEISDSLEYREEDEVESDVNNEDRDVSMFQGLGKQCL